MRINLSSEVAMTSLALTTLLDTTPRLINRLFGFWAEVICGIAEARAMALLYKELAALSDRELAARGLLRSDIPRAVLATGSGR
jgi:hypothetical protein